MRHQKPLAVRIFIRICVIFMAISLIGVYVVYMFAPSQETVENEEGTDINTGDTVELVLDETAGDNVGTAEEDIIMPEIDPENPENTSAPIVVTEDGEIDEMDLTREVQLENGEVEIVRQGDLGDAIQITQ